MNDDELNRDDEPARSLAVLSRLRSRFPELFEGGELSIEAVERRLRSAGEARPQGGGPSGESVGPRALEPEPPPTLTPLPEASRRWDDTRNTLVLGDNLAGLAGLQAGGEQVWGALDMVYLDPPYNTGNAFMYSDRHGRRGKKKGARAGDDVRASAWAEMVAPRLVAARELLKQSGFLCVSIDDNEVHTVRTMLDEVFGASNRIATIVVSMNAKGRQLAPHFASAHEYVLIYARDLDRCVIRSGLPEAVNPDDFPLEDGGGRYRLLPLRNTNKKFNPETRPNLAYPLFIDRENGAVDVVGGAGCIKVTPVFGTGAPAVWRWSRGKVEQERERLFGREVRGKTGRRWDVFQRDYNHAGRTKKLTSVWLSKDIGTTDAAARELKARGVGEFDTPKPLALMRRLCALSPPEARVADLFAGSGTTGEALLQLNAEQGATRSFVLIQNEDGAAAEQRNIADLTCARLAAACGALEDVYAGGDDPPSLDLGFRVYRCEDP